MTPTEALEALKLSIVAQFVPFSQSRHKAQDNPDLNWNVTVKCGDRVVMVTEYSAGMGQCPSYDRKTVPTAFQHRNYKSHADHLKTRFATATEILGQYRNAACAAECEFGFEVEIDQWRGLSGKPDSANVFKVKSKAAPILPKPEDVFYSIVMDSSVLDSGGFEDWAGDLGMDTDSRQAEALYKACLEIALKMRGAIGDSGMGILRGAFQDY